MKKIPYAQQDSITREVEEFIRDLAPKDTWNLADNGLTREYLGDGKWRIYVQLEVAPYMPYTNEPWISPKWHGAKNPNEGWWHVACQNAMEIVANRLKGTIKQ